MHREVRFGERAAYWDETLENDWLKRKKPESGVAAGIAPQPRLISFCLPMVCSHKEVEENGALS